MPVLSRPINHRCRLSRPVSLPYGRHHHATVPCDVRFKAIAIVQVLATIKRGSGARRRLAFALLAVSGAFVRARRIVEGVALQYARTPRPALAYFWAAATAAVLWPLHR